MVLDSFPNPNDESRLGWPLGVKDLEIFLISNGLVCEQRMDSGPMGNKLLQYGNEDLEVQVVRDRGDCFVRIAGRSRPNSWYPMSLLREFLGSPREEVPRLQDEIDFLRNNWAAIVSAFDESHRDQTHKRLYDLGREAVHRRFPGLISNS